MNMSINKNETQTLNFLSKFLRQNRFALFPAVDLYFVFEKKKKHQHKNKNVVELSTRHFL